MLQPHIFGVNEKNIFKVRLEHLDIEPRRIYDLRSTGSTFASAEGTDINHYIYTYVIRILIRL